MRNGLERLRFIAKIDTLKEIATEYPGKTIENIIVQMKARRSELRKQLETNKH